MLCCDGIRIFYDISGSIDHVQVCINGYVQKIGSCGWGNIHGHDLIEFLFQVVESEYTGTNVFLDTVLRCQFFRIVGKHIWPKFSGITVIVHDQRFYGWSQDFN